MRVRHLHQHLMDEGILISERLDLLAGVRIGIDALHWLRSIPTIKDPLASPIGGVPPSLFTVLDRELERITHHATVVFVFPGMEAGLLNAPAVMAQTDLQHPQQLEIAWGHMRRGNLRMASQFFALSTSRVNDDILALVFHHLKFKGFEVLQAPYASGPQLSYLSRAGFVDWVYGPAGLVLYKCRQVIVDFHHQTHVFFWTSWEHLLERFQLTQDQFFDACMLAGTEDCSTHPLIGGIRDGPLREGEQSHFGRAMQCVREAPFEHWAQQLEVPELQQAAMDAHACTKALVQWAPVMLQQSNMEVCPLELAPLHQNDGERVARMQLVVPPNLADLTGDMLPSRLYFLLVNGFAPTKLVQALARGEWLDKTQPFIDTAAYRELLLGLKAYRKQALGLLAQPLDDAFRTKRITHRTWWELERDPFHFGPVRVLKPRRLQGCFAWRVMPEAVREELQRQGEDRVSLKFCLEWHDRECRGEGALRGRLVQDCLFPGEPSHQHDAQSLSALVHLQLLEQLELIENAGNTRLSFALKDAPPQFLEPCLLALELMKQGMLSSDPFVPGDNERLFPRQVDYPEPPSTPAVRARLFLSRVMSLYPMRLKSAMWNADVDFDLAAFHCLVSVLLRHLSQLASASLCALLMEDISRLHLVIPGYASPPPSGGGDANIQAILPRFALPRTCMGVVFLYFLDYDPETPGTFAENLTAAFPCCHSPLHDLKQAMLFWEELRRIMATIAVFDHVGTREIAAQVQAAARLLQDRQTALRVFPDGQGGVMEQPDGEPLYRQMLNEFQPPPPPLPPGQQPLEEP